MAANCFRRSDAVRHSIDQEIGSLLGRIRLKRTLRNDASPISLLPNEILSEILLLATADSRNNLTTCLRLTHVCRKWRDVGLSFPQLWSNIRFMSPEKARVWLERSEGASLDVQFLGRPGPYNQHHSDAAGIVLAHMHRIRHLTVRSDGRVITVADKYMRHPAPLLESFTFDSAMHAGYGRYNLSDLFGGAAPRLRSFRLEGCSTDWSSPILSNLTTLAIVGVRGDRILLSQILEILGRCPCLQTLVLKDSLHKGSDMSSDLSSVPSTHLPSLRSADISSHGAECVALLGHLSIPSAANVRVKRDGSAESSEFSTLLMKLAPFARDGPHPPNFVNLYIDMLQSHYTLSSTKKYLTGAQSGSFPPVDKEIHALVLDFPHRTESKAAELSVLAKTFGSSELQRLHVKTSPSIRDPLTVELWREIDGSYPHLKHVRIFGQGGASFFAALRSSRQDPKKRGPPFAFPQLRSIWLEELDFPRASPEYIADSLAHRQEHKAQIKKLTIKQCRWVSEEDVWRYEQAVGTLDWNGIFGGCSDDEDEEDGYGPNTGAPAKIA